MTGIAPTLGVLAGVVGVAGMAPYLRDTVRRATRPCQGTWLIWGLLSVVVCTSQRADDASWSLVMAGTHAVLNVAVVVLAIRLGAGGVSAIDAVLMAIAGAGVAGWLIADEPIVATVCVVAADLVATAMMLPKTWRDPDSETLSTFALASVGGLLAAGSVGALEPALLLYPAYYALVNGTLALLIRHRRAVRHGPRPAPSTLLRRSAATVREART